MELRHRPLRRGGCLPGHSEGTCGSRLLASKQGHWPALRLSLRECSEADSRSEGKQWKLEPTAREPVASVRATSCSWGIADGNKGQITKGKFLFPLCRCPVFLWSPFLEEPHGDQAGKEKYVC